MGGRSRSNGHGGGGGGGSGDGRLDHERTPRSVVHELDGFESEFPPPDQTHRAGVEQNGTTSSVATGAVLVQGRSMRGRQG